MRVVRAESKRVGVVAVNILEQQSHTYNICFDRDEPPAFVIELDVSL